MLEIVLRSIFTVLPDYLYRRYVQHKRIGKEITLFSVWFELRYGITACLMLTVALITIIFLLSSLHQFGDVVLPDDSDPAGIRRTGQRGPDQERRPLETMAAVAEARQRQAAGCGGRRKPARQGNRISDAGRAGADIVAADGQIQQARSALEQTTDELRTKQELVQRNPNVVAAREIEKLETVVDGRRAQVASAEAARQAAQLRLSTLLPAEKETAEATLRQTQIDLDKTVIYAGVAGQVEQFALRVGDIVNPLMRAAGVLIPQQVGRPGLRAGQSR